MRVYFVLLLSGAIFADVMNDFIPHSIDGDSSLEGILVGDVKAGFPSPADDVREKLDIVKLLVKHKASTFFFRVNGVSMVDAAMDEGDIIARLCVTSMANIR